jgi:hypothetical protein
MDIGRVFNHDGIARGNWTGFEHNTHDAGLADQLTIHRAAKNRGKQTWHERFDLRARIAQAGELHQGLAANSDHGTSREREEVKMAGCDVFSHLTGQNMQSFVGKFSQQFAVQEVHLPKVRLTRIFGDP